MILTTKRDVILIEVSEILGNMVNVTTKDPKYIQTVGNDRPS